MSLDNIPPREVGERLRIARETKGFTQAGAAEKIEFARTTLVAIEKGQRRVKIDELQKLAQCYETSVNALLRRESVHVDLVPRFRKLQKSTEDASSSAAQLLTDLAKAEIELENLLGIKRSHNYPPERPLLPGNVKAQAEADALELRQWLGLGNSPVRDIISVLELDLGIRIYIRNLDQRVSGLFAYDERLGACMLLNANHPLERRALTAVHETGHFISTRMMPDVLHINEQVTSREERYANAFSHNFLMPARAVMQKFEQVTAGSSTLTRRHIIIIAYSFGVSREAMVMRLEELGLARTGTWSWFEENGGITNAQTHQVLGDLTPTDSVKSDAARPTTLRLNILAEEAWRQELLSEGQLARLLQMDRLELRGILDGIETEGGQADGMPKLLD